jgi:ATP-dependent DNA ligase
VPDPEGLHPYIGAMLLAYYTEDDRLIYAGRVGGGMSREVLNLAKLSAATALLL